MLIITILKVGHHRLTRLPGAKHSRGLRAWVVDLLGSWSNRLSGLPRARHARGLRAWVVIGLLGTSRSKCPAPALVTGLSEI